MNYPAMINGRLHGWNDITMNVGGTPVSGVQAINYKDNQVIDNVYAAGKFPTGRGEGQVSFEGNITLLKEEVDSLVNAIPSGRLQDYPEFPITVVFLPEGSNNFTTHQLLYCRFKNNGIDVKSGDSSVATQIELAIGDIKWK